MVTLVLLNILVSTKANLSQNIENRFFIYLDF
jgi:hypothetical protein